MEEAQLVRQFALQKMRALKIFVSTLGDEEQAMRALDDPATSEAIANFVLVQLGYSVEEPRAPMHPLSESLEQR